MSSFLRRISTRRLLALCAAALAVVAGGTAIAVASSSGGPVPAKKPLANAIHDALAAPSPQGVTADISFTNRLLSGMDLRGSNPLLSGASGRVWAANDGRFRLELKSSGGGSDANLVSDGTNWWAYDGQGTVYRGTVPQRKESGADKNKAAGQVPTIASIQQQIDQLMRHAGVSGAKPTDVNGEPAYTVRVSPKQNGGLLGGVALAWDATHGVPLRAGIYAKGQSDPVLELTASNISFGTVDASALNIQPPAGAKTQNVAGPQQGAADAKGSSHHKHGAGAHKASMSLATVQAAVPFKVAAPSSVAGRSQHGVDLIGKKGADPGAVVTYGNGLDGIAVIERSASAKDSKQGNGNGPLGRTELPTVNIGGASAQEISTPLGTVIQFDRGGVHYIVIGSVPKAAAEAAARAL